MTKFLAELWEGTKFWVYFVLVHCGLKVLTALVIILGFGYGLSWLDRYVTTMTYGTVWGLVVATCFILFVWKPKGPAELRADWEAKEAVRTEAEVRKLEERLRKVRTERTGSR